MIKLICRLIQKITFKVADFILYYNALLYAKYLCWKHRKLLERLSLGRNEVYIAIDHDPYGYYWIYITSKKGFYPSAVSKLSRDEINILPSWVEDLKGWDYKLKKNIVCMYYNGERVKELDKG